MKQKIVIQVSMSCDESRSKAMTLAARMAGVISMGIAGDDRDRLEVVGVGVDSVCLVCRLRRKLGHADIIQVEEVKDKKPDEKKPEEKKPKEKKPKPAPVPAPPCSPPGYYYHHPQMAFHDEQVVCDEPSDNCAFV